MNNPLPTIANSRQSSQAFYANSPVYDKRSWRDVFKTAPSFSALLVVRRRLLVGLATGKLRPEAKTARKWIDAFESRVMELAANAQTAGELCFIVNTSRRLLLDDAISQLNKIAVARFAALPSPAQQLRANGIAIQGVTD